MWRAVARANRNILNGLRARSARRLRAIILVCVAISVMSLAVLGPKVLQVARTSAPRATAPPTTTALIEGSQAILSQSVPSGVATAQYLGPHNATDTLPFMVLLQPNNVADLNHLVSTLYDPTSAQYHQWLPPGEFGRHYGPTTAQMNAVTTFLGQHDIQVNHNSGSLAVAGTATTADLETAFRTPINDYQLNGTQFFANGANIQVPADLASLVDGVSINNLSTMHSQMARVPANYDPCAQDDCLGPSEIRTVYDANPVYNTLHDDGQGQTLALVEFSLYTRTDIGVYEQRYSLPNVPISDMVIDVPSSTLDHNFLDHSSASEVEMDIELAIALAPGLQHIFVYQAPNTDAGDVVMYDRIATDDAAKVVSTSWGECEAGTQAWVASAEFYAFVRMAAQGQTMLSASGDTGAFDCLGDTKLAPLPMPKALQVLDPASQPWVTAIGGTSLAGAHVAVVQGYPVGKEHSWNDNCAPSACTSLLGGGASGGGGVSRLWSVAGLGVQNGPGVSEQGYSQSGGWCGAVADTPCREVPDVSMNADGYSPYWMYCSDNGDTNCTRNHWSTNAGTSAAAPLWAAIVALMRQHGQFAGGLLTPLLYSFDSPHGYCFQLHDITQGTNGYYPTGANYDMATGLGSPDIFYLVEPTQIGSGCPHGGPTPTPTPGPNLTPTPTPAPPAHVTEYPIPVPSTGGSLFDIVAGPDGALWFTEGTAVGRITTSGHITLYTLPSGIDAVGITSGPDEALWFTGMTAVGRITTSGSITSFPLPSDLYGTGGVTAITAGPDGALWFIGGSNGQFIGRITTSGSASQYAIPSHNVPAAITSGPDGALWFTAGNIIERLAP